MGTFILSSILSVSTVVQKLPFFFILISNKLLLNTDAIIPFTGIPTWEDILKFWSTIMYKGD
jgi:hypothetical protein